MAGWTEILSEKFTKNETEKLRILELINEIEREIQIVVEEIKTNPVLTNAKWQRSTRSSQFNPQWNLFINGAGISFTREELEEERHSLVKTVDGYEPTFLRVKEALQSMLLSKINWGIPE